MTATFRLELLRQEQPRMRAHFHGGKTEIVFCPGCSHGPYVLDHHPIYVQPTDTEVDCGWCGRVYKVVRP